MDACIKMSATGHGDGDGARMGSAETQGTAPSTETARTGGAVALTTCYVPQELQTAVDHIMPLIHQYRTERMTCDKELELEVRLGRRNRTTQRWDSEVSRSFFVSTMEMLKSYGGWTAPPATIDMHDFFYVTPAGKRVRTTLEFGTPCKLTHVCKQPVALRDIKLVDHSCDARVSLKLEAAIPAEELPDVVSTVLVRVKKRTSFQLDNWRIDMTQVWSGKTRNEAEQNQANGVNSGHCTHEVEVEFCGSRAYLAAVTDQYIATSLLLKLCSVLGSGVIYMLPFIAPRS
jgi:hypothetical protein